MTQTLSTNAFYLEKPSASIFVGLDCREFPNIEMINGFIHNKMGIKLRKHTVQKYADEQTHYKKYLKKLIWENEDEEYISTRYYHSAHGWGRINPDDSLSLSVFHRPSRHSFAKEKYLDLDIENAQIKLVMEKAIKQNLPIDGLDEYCDDHKKCRVDIAKHYKLKDIKGDDGFTYTAEEQAKKLPLRLAFGGSIIKWKEEVGAVGISDMPLILKMDYSLSKICEAVWEQNPHICEDASKTPEFMEKTENDKKRSVMGLFAQTWERIIQEECIAYLVRAHKSVRLQDIVSCQDGFMPLLSQIKTVDIPSLLEVFNLIIKKKYDMNIRWAVKPFKEAFPIPLSNKIPISITLDDLEKGERHISSLIAITLRKQLIYYQKENVECWFYANYKNLWIKSKKADEYVITKTIQDYIEDEKMNVWHLIKAATDDDKKKKLAKDESQLTKYYSKVGSSSYSSQVAKFLKSLLLQQKFTDKLDLTAGKMVFADGILDLKTNTFQDGFKHEDYITQTLTHKYSEVKNFDATKMKTLKEHLTKITNNKNEHFEYFMGIMGYSMTGDAHLEKSIYYIVDGTENQVGDNGKTFIFSLIEYAFPELVKQTDPKVLEEGYAKVHKHMATWKLIRLLYADEGTKKLLNDSLIKKIADGLTIENEIMFGCVEIINVMFKMFICSNYLPNIGKDKEAVFNRYKQIQNCSHFDRTGKRTVENVDKLEFIADPKLGDLLKKDYLNEIINLVLEYAVKYYQCGIPPIPSQFQAAASETKKQNNDFAVWFYDNFEVDMSDDSKISMESIMNYSYKGLNRDEMVKEIKKLEFVYYKDLVGFGNREDGKVIKGGFKNLKRIFKEDEE